MKLKIILILIAFCLLGCHNPHIDGISVGAMYFRANVGSQEISEVVPIGLVNIKFGDKE